MKRFGQRIISQAILTVLANMTLFLSVQAAEPNATVSFSTKQLPSWAETAWSKYKEQRAGGQKDASAETLNEVRKQAAGQGIEGFDLPAAVMIQEGEEALSKGDIEKAVETGEAARQWSPDDPNSAFFLAEAQFEQHPFSPVAAVGNYLSGLLAAIQDFWFSFYIVGRMVLIFLVGLFGSFLIFFVFLLIRYLPLLVHGIQEWVGIVLNRPAIWVLVLTLLLTPLYLGISPIYILFLGLCIVWWFMTGSERLISAGLVAGLSLSVFWLPVTFSWLTAGQSPELLLLSQVVRSNADATGWVSRVEEQSDYGKNWRVLFSVALQKKREGNYPDALERYQQLQKLEPDRSIILNNIGNVYFLMQRYDDATKSYKLSIANNPSDAASHYNLSLVYRELLRFDDAEQELEAAQRINLSLIRSNPGTGPIDELFSKANLWKVAFSNSPSKEADSQKLFGMIMSPLTLEASPYLMLFVAGGVIAMRLALSRKYTATQCTLCGRPICYHCQRRIMDIKTCSTCWRNFKNVKRKSDLNQIKIRRRRIFRMARLISIPFPGAGHYYFGREMKGFVIQGIYIGILFTFFFGNGFFRAPTEHGAIVGTVGLSLILFMVVIIYLLVFFDILNISNDKP
jgi:tetratricopeptide (TPR) repeat protein